MDQLLEYKCPCCGGSIGFDSGSQKLKCPYCDTEFDIDTLKSYDDALKSEKPDSMEWDDNAERSWNGEEDDGMSVYVCKSCGGEIVCDRTTAATSCPYCGNPVVMTGRLAGDLMPDYIIPFKYDRNAAKAGMMNHLKGKKLLPKVFSDENHIDEIKGIYVPVWLFDTDAEAGIRYRATKIRRWSDSDYDYTETSHFTVIREGSLGFDNVPVDGSTKMDDALMESIEPFNFAEAVDFRTAYLSGYLADRYDVSSEDSKPRANERIKRSTENAFASTVTGYSTVTPESSSVRFNHGRVKYALYPVWLLNTTWKGKKYYFAMNGQTGRFVGDLPVDWGAYWKWFGIWTAIFAAGTFLTFLLAHLL